MVKSATANLLLFGPPATTTSKLPISFSFGFSALPRQAGMESACFILLVPASAIASGKSDCPHSQRIRIPRTGRRRVSLSAEPLSRTARHDRRQASRCQPEDGTVLLGRHPPHGTKPNWQRGPRVPEDVSEVWQPHAAHSSSTPRTVHPACQILIVLRTSVVIAGGVKVELAQIEQPSASPPRLLLSGLPGPGQWQALDELRHTSGRSKPLPGSGRWHL